MKFPLCAKTALLVTVWRVSVAYAQDMSISSGSVACVTSPDLPGITMSAVTCDDMESFGTGTALGFGTEASGFASTALGQLTIASGNVAVAMGFNCTAGGNSSFATGVNSRTVSDPLVPEGSSGGGAMSMGLDCMSTGDWALSVGSGSEAVGYASAAIGENAVAHTWGEVALGLYTEESDLSIEEKRSQSVIPTFREEDVVLRVGIGCSKKEHIGGIGCEEERRQDALRVYKSGRLYIKKLDGSIIEDVAAEIERSKDDIETLKEEIEKLKEELESLKQGSSGGRRRLAASPSWQLTQLIVVGALLLATVFALFDLVA